jgi:MFS family permease
LGICDFYRIDYPARFAAVAAKNRDLACTRRCALQIIRHSLVFAIRLCSLVIRIGISIGENIVTMSSTLEELRQRYGTRYKWLVLLTVMIGSMASILSSTIVNVAVPDLSRYFVLGQERAQWVSAAFMLAMTLSMLTTPWLLLRYGLRKTYTAAILVLLAGGVIGGFSINYPMLLSMRVLEGLASGILQPIPAIVIMRAFDEKEQGKAMGIFGFGVVLAPAMGPSVGGFLVEQFGWRSIFFVVVPFCLAVLVMIRRYLAINSPMMGDAKALDWTGLLLVGASTISVLNGLVLLHHELLQAAGLLMLGAVCFAAFIFCRTAFGQYETVSLSAVYDGCAGFIHIRHGLVWLDVFIAGLYANRIAVCAVASGAGFAAGRDRVGFHDAIGR